MYRSESIDSTLWQRHAQAGGLPARALAEHAVRSYGQVAAIIFTELTFRCFADEADPLVPAAAAVDEL